MIPCYKNQIWREIINLNVGQKDVYVQHVITRSGLYVLFENLYIKLNFEFVFDLDFQNVNIKE